MIDSKIRTILCIIYVMYKYKYIISNVREHILCNFKIVIRFLTLTLKMWERKKYERGM
jgi:hypothetical protein